MGRLLHLSDYGGCRSDQRDRELPWEWSPDARLKKTRAREFVPERLEEATGGPRCPESPLNRVDEHDESLEAVRAS